MSFFLNKMLSVRGENFFLHHPDTNVLLSSGYGIDAKTSELLNGCEGFIQKPYDIMNLSQQVRNILDNI